MSVGKRIYLKRRMPDPELVKAFETIPASNVADVMGRNCASTWSVLPKSG